MTTTTFDPALAGAYVNLDDFEEAARVRMDPAAFDYVEGGAWDEVTLAENVAAWRRRRFRPRVLVDVGQVSTASTMLGRPVSMPVAIAPMAAHGIAHPEGERGTARGSAAAGVPFALSTMSTFSIEDVAAAAPAANLWFQLYTQADPGVSRALCERAAAAGYTSIMVTVDLPRLGYRDRDRRSGFSLQHLGNFAGTDGPTHRSLDSNGFERLNTTQHASLTWDDLARIRSWTSLPFVLKGIMTAEDARLAVEHGVDAIVVSNHGARQLDRALAAADALPEVVEAVRAAGAKTEVWVDGGIRRGLDVALALALGANGVLVGRPAIWALAAGGEAGVERALAILREELEIALALIGAPTVADLQPGHLAPTP